jgi:hypothetical protein
MADKAGICTERILRLPGQPTGKAHHIMATNIKYFLGTLNVTIGEYSNNVRILVAANSDPQADEVLEHAAASYYGEGDEEREDGGYYANNGEVHTKASSLVEIGAATFYELRCLLSVHHAGNVKLQDLDAATEPGFKAFAKATANALKAEGIEVKHTKMLEALASGLGQKNWQVLQAKFQAPVDAHPELSSFEGRDENKHALLSLFQELEAANAKVHFEGGTWEVEICSRQVLGQALDNGLYQDALQLKLLADAGERVVGHRYRFLGTDFAGAIVEDYTTVILTDGARLTFELTEKSWSANVCRTGYGFADFVVNARTSAEAEERALDTAGNYSYSEKNSDYEVDWVTPVK